MSKSNIKLDPGKTMDHLLQYVKNSEAQISKGKRPTSLCIEGKAGIAKTSLVKQLAAELGYRLHQINAAMIDDLGHLVGFPQKEYAIKYSKKVNDTIWEEKKWVPAEFSEDCINDGGTYTGESRMSYANPHWLQSVNPDEKFILLLDDFTRGLPLVMQACMTLIEEYRYGSWELPKNTIIILTTNPDNGEYSVSSLDTAQRTRMRYIEMVFDTDAWARWAESDGIDGRCINFVLHNPELFSEKHDGIGGSKEFNARSMTKFFEDIGQMEDFASALSYVKTCGDGAVGNRFTDMFLTFINNKLDKLPNPKEILAMSTEKALVELTKVCGNYKTKEAYNPATASIMASRLVNYTIFGQHEQWGKAENQKMIALILHTSFSEDLKFYMAKQFVTEPAKKQSGKLQDILGDKRIIDMIFSN